MEYPVKSFRQFVTEADTVSGVIGGAGGTPASNAAMADDIAAFSSRGRSMAGDIASRFTANLRRRQDGASWAQIHNALKRTQDPNSHADAFGEMQALYGRSSGDYGAHEFHNSFIQNPDSDIADDIERTTGADPADILRAFRAQRSALGLRRNNS